MTQKLLTQKIITGCIAGTDNGKQNHKFAKILAIVMFIISAILCVFPGWEWKFCGIIFWGIVVVAVFTRYVSERTIKAILEKKYIIYQDVCISKDIDTSTDSLDTPYLKFKNFGRCSARFPMVILNSEAVLTSPHIYKTAEPGDSFYILCHKKKRVLYVFNCKYWKIDESEFSQTNGVFVPNK